MVMRRIPVVALALAVGLGPVPRTLAQSAVDPSTPRSAAAVLQLPAADKGNEAQQAANALQGAEVPRQPEVLRQGQEPSVRSQPEERPVPAKAPPGEFERFVETTLGQPLPVFGAWLATDGARTYAPAAEAMVPPDYTFGPGDEIIVRTTGSIESDLRLVVDRSGQVYIPRVGRVTVMGIRQDQLAAHLTAQVANRFRRFELSVSVGRLHGIRVYVTGFARTPGSYTLGSLSTVVNALMAAGGPGPGGSFRSIELHRGGKTVTAFDLYDLLLSGDKSRDAVLQGEDVVHVGPVGPQVAIYGSVNGPGIFEAKPGETLGDLLRFAGGLSSVADPTRFAVERLANRDHSLIEQVPLALAPSTPLERGDIYRIFSAVDVALPLERQAMVVRVEGEVNRPGEYMVPPGTRLSAVIAQAGGFTPRAFLYGSEFTRETVRRRQQVDYDRALQNFELDVSNAALTTRSLGQEDAASRTQQLALVGKLMERLRQVHPNGRVVLDVAPGATGLPDMPLESSDRLYVPPRPTTVQVFGSVFSPGSFAYQPGLTLDAYLHRAGGPKRTADKGSIFLVRANGTVQSNLQGWTSDVTGEDAQPGDTIFVPDEMNRSTFLQSAKDFGSIFFQYSVGALALKVLFGL